MKKSTSEKFYITVTLLFLVLCLVPSIGVLLFGPSAANANEIRSPLPTLIYADGTLNADFLSGLTDWFDDRFQLRPELSTVWARLNASLFHSSVEDSVLLGSDGWLYYADSLDDYTGALLPEETIDAAAKNLQHLQQRCEEQGIAFVFTVAPNKNSLYSEHMDACYIKGDSSNAELLYKKLDERNVNYVNLHETFRSQSETLYFQTDSHWTSQGAALAADAILGALQSVSCAGSSPDYAIFPLASVNDPSEISGDGSLINAIGNTVPVQTETAGLFFAGPFQEGEVHIGDLFEMLYPAAVSHELDKTYLPGFTFRELSSARGGEAINFTTESSSARFGRLLCWRDSFGNSLYPYLAEAFSSADFSRENPYDPEKITSESYDAVIIEIVERNISWLASQEAVS